METKTINKKEAEEFKKLKKKQLNDKELIKK